MHHNTLQKNQYSTAKTDSKPTATMHRRIQNILPAPHRTERQTDVRRVQCSVTKPDAVLPWFGLRGRVRPCETRESHGWFTGAEKSRLEEISVELDRWLMYGCVCAARIVVYKIMACSARSWYPLPWNCVKYIQSWNEFPVDKKVNQACDR